MVCGMVGLHRTSHETLTGFMIDRLPQRELTRRTEGNPTFGLPPETGADVLDLS
jgi:hypothetical protein